MVQSDYITAAQAAAADASSLQVVPNSTYGTGRRAVRVRLRQAGADPSASELATVEQGGLKIYTTIDLDKQQEAREAILAHEGEPGDPAAALVTIDPTNGHILAMATSSSYGQTKFDYATQAHRQTGSAFKVFVLMTLIHDYDGDPNTTYYNSHEFLPGWLPGYPTYSGPHRRGQLPGRHQRDQGDHAVRQHRVRAAGRRRRARQGRRSTAHAMGITSPLDGLPGRGASAACGSASRRCEMADAYATLANGGVHIPPTAITKVVFPDGNRRQPRRSAPQARVLRRRGVRRHAGAQDRGHRAEPAPPPTTAARRPARPARRATTPTPGSSATRRSSRPRCGSAIRTRPSRWTTSTGSAPASAARWPRRSGTTTWSRRADGYCGDFTPPTVPWQGVPFVGPLRDDGTGEHARRRPAPRTAPAGRPPTGTTTTDDDAVAHRHRHRTESADAERERRRRRDRAQAARGIKKH